MSEKVTHRRFEIHSSRHTGRPSSSVPSLNQVPAAGFRGIFCWSLIWPRGVFVDESCVCLSGLSIVPRGSLLISDAPLTRSRSRSRRRSRNLSRSLNRPIISRLWSPAWTFWDRQRDTWRTQGDLWKAIFPLPMEGSVMFVWDSIRGTPLRVPRTPR